MRDQAGFTLLELVCVLAIVAILAALILPAMPRQTSSARLEMLVLKTAALLTADRDAAIRLHAPISTSLNSSTRTIRSGASSDFIELPHDVAFDALLAERCNGRVAGPNIEFFPSGMSCGGTIAMSRPGMGYEVRVNWLTGAVNVVSSKER